MLKQFLAIKKRKQVVLLNHGCVCLCMCGGGGGGGGAGEREREGGGKINQLEHVNFNRRFVVNKQDSGK